MADCVIYRICVTVFFNGELAQSRILKIAILYATNGKEGNEYFSGRRVDSHLEIPWIIVPDSDESSTKGSSSFETRWNEINSLLLTEANEWGMHGNHRSVMGEYLEELSKRPAPTKAGRLENGRGGRVGVIDVVITLGRSVPISAAGLKGPRRKLHEDFTGKGRRLVTAPEEERPKKKEKNAVASRPKLKDRSANDRTSLGLEKKRVLPGISPTKQSHHSVSSISNLKAPLAEKTHAGTFLETIHQKEGATKSETQASPANQPPPPQNCSDLFTSSPLLDSSQTLENSRLVTLTLLIFTNLISHEPKFPISLAFVRTEFFTIFEIISSDDYCSERNRDLQYKDAFSSSNNTYKILKVYFTTQRYCFQEKNSICTNRKSADEPEQTDTLKNVLTQVPLRNRILPDIPHRDHPKLPKNIPRKTFKGTEPQTPEKKVESPTSSYSLRSNSRQELSRDADSASDNTIDQHPSSIDQRSTITDFHDQPFSSASAEISKPLQVQSNTKLYSNSLPLLDESIPKKQNQQRVPVIIPPYPRKQGSDSSSVSKSANSASSVTRSKSDTLADTLKVILSSTSGSKDLKPRENKTAAANSNKGKRKLNFGLDGTEDTPLPLSRPDSTRIVFRTKRNTSSAVVKSAKLLHGLGKHNPQNGSESPSSTTVTPTSSTKDPSDSSDSKQDVLAYVQPHGK
jgi:hypothetical protein